MSTQNRTKTCNPLWLTTGKLYKFQLALLYSGTP